MPSGHIRNGSSFYIADPYWWDGTYPNAARFTWGQQYGGAWQVCFWTSDAATSGVFFRIETRSEQGWRVPVNNDFSSAGGTFLDGATRVRIGKIIQNQETVVIDRYFDTQPQGGPGEEGNETYGAAIFSVVKTADGYAASAHGPRTYTAFSFPCSDVFDELPLLLTKSWLDSSPRQGEPNYVLPAKVRIDLGAFTFAPTGQSLVYDTRIYHRGKAHPPEGRPSFVNHIDIGDSSPPAARQRFQSDSAEVGVYAQSGNRPVPYLPAGSNPQSIVLTITPTSALRNQPTGPPNALMWMPSKLASLGQRTLRVPLAGGSIQSLGTRFFFPSQQVPSSSATEPDSPAPTFSGHTSNQGTQRILVEYPSWGSLSIGTQAVFSPRWDHFFGATPPYDDGEPNYNAWIEEQRQAASRINQSFDDWHNPGSTRTAFDWGPMNPSPSSLFYTIHPPAWRGYTYQSGSAAAAYVGLTPRIRSRLVADTSDRNLETHTSEGFRTETPARLARTFVNGCEGIAVRNAGPASASYTELRYRGQLVKTEVIQPAGRNTFFGFIPIVLADGTNRFKHIRIDPDFNKPPIEITALNRHVSYQLNESIELYISNVPTAAFSDLIKNGSATYNGTAGVLAVYGPGNSYGIGECDVTVGLAFE